MNCSAMVTRVVTTISTIQIKFKKYNGFLNFFKCRIFKVKNRHSTAKLTITPIGLLQNSMPKSKFLRQSLNLEYSGIPTYAYNPPNLSHYAYFWGIITIFMRSNGIYNLKFSMCSFNVLVIYSM